MAKIETTKEINGIKLRTTRKNKDGNYLHATDVKATTKRVKAVNPGEFQIDEVLFRIDENARTKVYVKNAYDIGLITYAGKKEDNYNKKLKDGTTKPMTRMTHQYTGKPFTYVQGDDGNLYLLVGAGIKAKGTLSEGWADLSTFVRNLVSPKMILDIKTPVNATFSIDKNVSSFYMVQVNGDHHIEKSEKAVQGYKLTLMGTTPYDDDIVTNLPAAPKKESTKKVVETAIDNDEF